MKKKQRGCVHNPQCQCLAGFVDCRSAVKDGKCSPSAKVRVDLGITLENTDFKSFARLLEQNGGRIPISGFVR